MTGTEKKLIDAAAEIHAVSPTYATAFLDGVSTAIKAMGAGREEASDDEDEAESDEH